jgi:hypothetical protein
MVVTSLAVLTITGEHVDDDTADQPRNTLTAAQRRDIAKIAGLTGWSNTVDRQKRMETPQKSSPADVRWHLKNLGYDADHPTKAQLAQAESSRKLYFARLAYRSAESRRARKRGGAASRKNSGGAA